MTKAPNIDKERLTEMMTAAIVNNNGNEPKSIASFRKAFDDANDPALWVALVPTDIIKSYIRNLFLETKPACITKKTIVRTHLRTTPGSGDEPTDEKSAEPPRLSETDIRERTRRQAQEELYRRSALYLMQIDGRPVGECTAEDLERAEIRAGRDARFYYLLRQGVPAGGVIRDYISPGEADTRLRMADDYVGMRPAAAD